MNRKAARVDFLIMILVEDMNVCLHMSEGEVEREKGRGVSLSPIVTNTQSSLTLSHIITNLLSPFTR
jgi:hypothetical protein